MDDFTPYRDYFVEALQNLEKVLKRWKKTHVSISTVKFHMTMKEIIVLGHLLSATGIWVDPAKVEVILIFPTPKTPTHVCILLGMFAIIGVYRNFF